MYFDKLKNLNIDENIYDSKKNKFKDIKVINMKRTKSFVFDLVKINQYNHHHFTYQGSNPLVDQIVNRVLKQVD